MDVAKKIGSEIAVAGGKASVVVEAAKYALDGIEALLEYLAAAAFLFLDRLGRDFGDGTVMFRQCSMIS